MEHFFVPEVEIPLGLDEPDGIITSFPIGRSGTPSLKTEEYVRDAEMEFTVITDADLKPKQWKDLWITAEMNGIGASRSQGYGKFKVVAWDKI